MSSIPPRLDEVNHHLGMYNQMIESVAKELEICVVHLWGDFQLKNHSLWSSKDSLHLSTNYRLPLLRTIASHINKMCMADVGLSHNTYEP